MTYDDVRSQLGIESDNFFREQLRHRLTVKVDGMIHGTALCCFAAEYLYDLFQPRLQKAHLHFVPDDIARMASFPRLSESDDKVAALRKAVASAEVILTLTRDSEKFQTYKKVCDLAFHLEEIRDFHDDFAMRRQQQTLKDETRKENCAGWAGDSFARTQTPRALLHGQA